MPLIITPRDLSCESEVRRTYFDKHTPVITCAPTAVRGEKFKVNVRIGISLKHPNTTEHYFSYIQLWNLETLVGEVRFSAGTFGSAPMQAEVDFYLVPKVSLRLTAMAYCTKHGLWKSEEVFVKAPEV